MTPWAVFLGYQEGFLNVKPMALYNIVDADNVSSRDKSTVGAQTLESIGIRVPHTPTFKQWPEDMDKKALDNVSGGGYAR